MTARNLNRAGSVTRASFEALGTVILVLLALAFAFHSPVPPVPNPGTPSRNGETQVALDCSPYSQQGAA